MGSTHTKLITRVHNNDNTIDKLLLTNQKLDTEVIKKLSKAILTNSVLQVISLQGSELSYESVTTLTNSIARSILNLTKLDFSNVALGATGAGRIATELLSCERRSIRLHTLILNGCQLEDDGCSIIFRELSTHHRCEVVNLELASNNIKAAPHIHQLLQLNTTLHGLSLFDNHLENIAIAELANGLRGNSSLRWLSLGYNDLGSAVCSILSNALPFNTHSALVWLGLGGNNIGDSGARLLANWLGTPSCMLYSLGLSSNLITVRGLQYIVRSISMEHSCVR